MHQNKRFDNSETIVNDETITRITNYFMISEQYYSREILLVDKQNKRFPIIDNACHSDRRVDTKQEEKDKYLGK